MYRLQQLISSQMWLVAPTFAACRYVGTSHRNASANTHELVGASPRVVIDSPLRPGGTDQRDCWSQWPIRRRRTRTRKRKKRKLRTRSRAGRDPTADSRPTASVDGECVWRIPISNSSSSRYQLSALRGNPLCGRNGRHPRRCALDVRVS